MISVKTLVKSRCDSKSYELLPLIDYDYATLMTLSLKGKYCPPSLSPSLSGLNCMYNFVFYIQKRNV